MRTLPNHLKGDFRQFAELVLEGETAKGGGGRRGGGRGCRKRCDLSGGARLSLSGSSILSLSESQQAILLPAPLHPRQGSTYSSSRGGARI